MIRRRARLLFALVAGATLLCGAATAASVAAPTLAHTDASVGVVSVVPTAGTALVRDIETNPRPLLATFFVAVLCAVALVLTQRRNTVPLVTNAFATRDASQTRFRRGPPLLPTTD